MRRKLLKTFKMIVVLVAVLVPLRAAAVELNSVPFPERRTAVLSFEATSIAPAADVTAEVYYRKGQARIEVSYEDMKPAILFGGDVTCFVVWAVTRDGQAENLGELLTRRRSGRLDFSTGKKNFAIMVTAESFYLVGQPSELVVFHNKRTVVDNVDSTRFSFSNLAPAPRHSMDAIAHILWDSKVPLDLLQARKAHELATRHEAEVHAKQIYIEAGEALKSANDIAETSPKSRDLQDVARRSVALSNEALNISIHRVEALELARQNAARRAETEALEKRAAEAEAAAEAARRLAEDVRAETEQTRTETAALRSEKAGLESTMVSLRQEKMVLQGEAQGLSRDKSTLEGEARRLREEKAALEIEAARQQQEKEELRAESSRLQREKDELSGRLQGALSHVADTQESVRGFVINLGDILFDLDEATLKPEAKLALAKLAGILLIMGDREAIIEGHTDSTGSADYNLDLSQRRANAVRHFLQAQGLDTSRLRAEGYGMQRPVADNTSAEGRKRNRRVEIVIGEPSDMIATSS